MTASFAILYIGADAHLALLDDTAFPKNAASCWKKTTLASSGFNVQSWSDELSRLNLGTWQIGVKVQRDAFHSVEHSHPITVG
jgi:hypothetical protein